MKYPLILLSIAFLSACSIMKKNCTSIDLKTENAQMVQASPANSMYIFAFGEGPLEGAQLHVNSQEAGRDKDLFIMNHKNPGVFSEAVNKEEWKWTEEFNEKDMTMSFKASVQMRYDGKMYCISLNYQGEGMKMMTPPPAPVPVPVPVPAPER